MNHHLEMLSSFFLRPSSCAFSLICCNADMIPLRSLQRSTRKSIRELQSSIKSGETKKETDLETSRSKSSLSFALGACFLSDWSGGGGSGRDLFVLFLVEDIADDRREVKWRETMGRNRWSERSLLWISIRFEFWISVSFVRSYIVRADQWSVCAQQYFNCFFLLPNFELDIIFMHLILQIMFGLMAHCGPRNEQSLYFFLLFFVKFLR